MTTESITIIRILASIVYSEIGGKFGQKSRNLQSNMKAGGVGDVKFS
jgi:hypothetical protein